MTKTKLEKLIDVMYRKGELTEEDLIEVNA